MVGASWLLSCSDSSGSKSDAGAGGTENVGGDGRGGSGHSGSTSGGSPSTGGTGNAAGTEASGGASVQGGTSNAGSSSLGGASGVTDGGTSAQQTSQGGSAAGGDTNSAGAAGTSVGGRHAFDYYQTDTEIRWVSTDGEGKLVDVTNGAVQGIRFPEADWSSDGHATWRRASVLMLKDGQLFRLEGEANAKVPPAPVRVSTVAGVQQICAHWLSSDRNDRSKSVLVFQYVTSGSCPSAGFTSTLPTIAVRLLAGPTDAPVSANANYVPLLDGSGTLADLLYVTEDQQLIRVASVGNEAELSEIVASNVRYTTAYSLGGSMFLLTVTHVVDSTVDLYVYDAATHTRSALLGNWFNVDFGITGIVHDDQYAFFTGTKTLGGPYLLYRMRTNGNTTVDALTDVSSNSAAVSIVGIAQGSLVYRTRPPLSAGIQSIDVGSSFSNPSPTTVLTGDFYAPLLSQNRLFYQTYNIASVVNLDGTHKEQYSTDGTLSRWVGCTRDASHDTLALARQSGYCSRVYLHAINAGGKGGTLRSYDAVADPGGAFFANAARAPVVHGEFPNELAMANPQLVDMSSSGSNPFEMPALELLTGVVSLAPTINDTARPVVFYFTSGAVGGGLTFTQTAFASWLSRGP
jgi:hypothetical protein